MSYGGHTIRFLHLLVCVGAEGISSARPPPWLDGWMHGKDGMDGMDAWNGCMEWMDACMECMHGWMGWMHGMDGWMHGMDGWMHGMDGWMHGMDAWMHGMDGCMDAWMGWDARRPREFPPSYVRPDKTHPSVVERIC